MGRTIAVCNHASMTAYRIVPRYLVFFLSSTLSRATVGFPGIFVFLMNNAISAFCGLTHIDFIGCRPLANLSEALSLPPRWRPETYPMLVL